MPVKPPNLVNDFTPRSTRVNPPAAVPGHLLQLDFERIRKVGFPRFLGIGAQKAGTSWLWKMLGIHSGLFLPAPKEHHYFDRELETVSPEEYAARFQTDDGRIAGEITPAYAALSDERVKLIHKLMPDARLIFLLRNPIERAWSQALMNLVIQNGRRYEDIPAADFYAHFDSPHSTSRGLYTATLDRWEKNFSREQLLVDFYENIKVDPQTLLARVLRHIGVSVPGDWSNYPLNEVYFEGVKVLMPDAYRTYLRRKFRGEIEQLYQRFGDRVAAWRVA